MANSIAWSKGIGSIVVLSSLMGCQALSGANRVPDDMMGLPAAPLSEVVDMFEQPDYLDGAPRQVIYRGKEVGLWLPMRATDAGCIAYSMALDTDELEGPDTEFFWHGDRYRQQEAGCVPMAEVVHSDPSDTSDAGASTAQPTGATDRSPQEAPLQGWPVGWQ